MGDFRDACLAGLLILAALVSGAIMGVGIAFIIATVSGAF